MHYLMFMLNETSTKLSALFECVKAFTDLRLRTMSPFPSEIALNIDAVLAAHRNLDWPAPVCGAMGA